MARRTRRRGGLSLDLPAGAAARARLAGELDVLGRELRAARAGKPRGVHQLRVVTRRLRALLALFEATLPRRTVGALADRLAALARASGPVRDLDVLLKAIARHGRKVDPALELAVATVQRHVRQRRAAAHAVLVETLDAPGTQRVTAQLAALVRTPGGGAAPLGTIAPDLVRPLVQKLARAGRDVDAAAPPAAMHRLRIRGKRLRYALEALDAGPATRKLARRLAALQRVLGDQRDAANERAWLVAEIPAFVGDAEALVAVGAIGEALRRRARRLAKAVPRAWARVDRPKLVAATLRELATAPAAGRKAA